MIAAIVNVGQLLQVVVYSLVAGVGIATVFGLGISGAGGLVDALREQRGAAAVAWGILVVLCAAVVVAAVVLGIVVMSTK